MIKASHVELLNMKTIIHIMVSLVTQAEDVLWRLQRVWTSILSDPSLFPSFILRTPSLSHNFDLL